MSAEARLAAKLAELKLASPSAPEPKGLYKSAIIAGNLLYTSGHLPVDASGKLITGRVGAELDAKAGYEAARLAGLGILATVKKQLGSLDRVARVLKIFGIVNSTADFTQQPAVVNGCSELFADVFGPDAGVGGRSAIGTNTLPLGVPVEIEAIFEIKSA
jgi:enamine deaminase RidA (YjgF/YER057c/UK114 family)